MCFLYTKFVLIFHNVFKKNGQNLSVPSTTCQNVQEDHNDDDDDHHHDDDDVYYVKVKTEVFR